MENTALGIMVEVDVRSHILCLVHGYVPMLIMGCFLFLILTSISGTRIWPQRRPNPRTPRQPLHIHLTRIRRPRHLHLHSRRRNLEHTDTHPTIS